MIISIHTQVESLKDYASTLGHGIKMHGQTTLHSIRSTIGGLFFI
jgi:hypothetical protein